MIFLHTTPDPAAPFWLLHFESLTLAKLILHPGGPHVLEVLCDTPPPDDAFREFSEAIESMGKGFSKGLTMAVHHGRPGSAPTILTLAPLKGPGFATLMSDIEIHTHPHPTARMAIAHGTTDPLGPIWTAIPADQKLRESIIRLALKTAAHQTQLDIYEPHLWLTRPDTLAT